MTITLAASMAMERGDLPGVLEGLTPDAVLHSPLTDRLVFRGRAEVGAVIGVLLEEFEDLHYHQEIRAEGTVVVLASARVAGHDIEILDHCQVDAEDRIAEMTVFFRPLPATTAALRVLGAGLARRNSPTRGAVVSGLTRPLGLMAATGDRLAVGLIGPLS